MANADSTRPAGRPAIPPVARARTGGARRRRRAPLRGVGVTPDPSEPTRSAAEEEIMAATHRALSKHGYADLSIARIADEFDKSKASLYYHYDSKDELLVAFLGYAADRFEATVDTETGDDPGADLEHVVEKLLPLELHDDDHHLQSVLVELRSQAVTDEAFREQFTRVDERLAATVRDIVERGIEEGTFRDVDPARVAEHVLAVVNGAMYGRATTDRRGAPAAVRVSLSSYLDAELRRS